MKSKHAATLAKAKRTAKRLGIEIPSFYGDKEKAGKQYRYYVWSKGKLLWAGIADDATHARAKYIEKLIRLEKQIH